MSRNLNLHPNHRDYGSTSSTQSTGLVAATIGGSSVISPIASTSTNTIIPEVSYSDFSPTEFMSLSENIAHNIQSVKSSWQQLEKALKVIGTNRDTQATRDKVHNIQTQTNIKIQATSKDLQRLTAVVKRGDKQQKLQVEKLTSDFKIIVEKYSLSQQQIAMKMKQVFLQQIHAQEQDDQQGSGQLIDAVSAANMTATEREQLIQRQKQFQTNLQFEQDLILDRENRIKEIEADVLDVNEIMKELSNLIHQQSEQIDTIESSIDRTCVEVEAGTSELMKAAQSRARYRRRICILLLIAVIIGLIITAIIVSQLKS